VSLKAIIYKPNVQNNVYVLFSMSFIYKNAKKEENITKFESENTFQI